MHEKDSLLPTVDSHGRLECKEIWGGIHSRDIELSAGKVIGSIYSAPVVGEVRAETSTILESARATQFRVWPSQMLQVTERRLRT